MPTVAKAYQRQTLHSHTPESITMDRKGETRHGHKDLEIGEKQNKVDENVFCKRWSSSLTYAVIASFGIGCFGSGFAVAYFTLPDTGKYSDVKKMSF